MASYYVWSGATGTGTGASWANAFTTLTTAFVTEVAGDTLYVAHDHAESAAGLTLTSSGTIAVPTKVVCVNRSGSVPPVSADRRATATVTTTAANNLTMQGVTHYDGIIFNAGTGASSSANIVLSTAASNWLRFDNCSFRFGIPIGNTLFVGGSAGSLGGTYVELNNTTFQAASTADSISVVNTLKWRNTASALLGATMPTGLFTPFASRGCSVECIGVDLSAMGSGKTIINGQAATGQGQSFRYQDGGANGLWLVRC